MKPTEQPLMRIIQYHSEESGQQFEQQQQHQSQAGSDESCFVYPDRNQGHGHELRHVRGVPVIICGPHGVGKKEAPTN